MLQSGFGRSERYWGDHSEGVPCQSTATSLEERVPGAMYPVQEQLRFPLRYATRASSTCNTQPGRFTVEGNWVLVYPDLSRNHRIADDDRARVVLEPRWGRWRICLSPPSTLVLGHRTVYAPRAIAKNPVAVITLHSGG